MTAQTPVYGLKYLVPGESMRATRQALQDNAQTIEAALIGTGVHPPSAADLSGLAALQATVTTNTSNIATNTTNIATNTTATNANTASINTINGYPYASLRQSTAQTGLASGTWVDILFQTADLDSVNGLVKTTGGTPAQYAGWKCPAGQAGVYAIEGAVVAAASAGTMNVRLQKNGTVLPTGQGPTTTGGAVGNSLIGRRIVSLAAGDYVGVQANFNTASWSTNVAAGLASWLMIERIR